MNSIRDCVVNDPEFGVDWLDEVLTAIDRVHEVPKELGTWTVTTDPLRNDGKHDVAGRMVERSPANGHDRNYIYILRNAHHPRTTLCHEIGHVIDMCVGRANSKTIRESEVQNGRFDRVVHALISSESYAGLAEYQRARCTDQGAHEPKFGFDFSYQLAMGETWARAYAQYVETKSENVNLTREYEEAMISLHRLLIWDRDEFLPIADEIDAAFHNLGWRPA